jgi:hypothetical protein
MLDATAHPYLITGHRTGRNSSKESLSTDVSAIERQFLHFLHERRCPPKNTNVQYLMDALL